LVASFSSAPPEGAVRRRGRQCRAKPSISYLTPLASCTATPATNRRSSRVHIRCSCWSVRAVDQIALRDVRGIVDASCRNFENHVAFLEAALGAALFGPLRSPRRPSLPGVRELCWRGPPSFRIFVHFGTLVQLPPSSLPISALASTVFSTGRRQVDDACPGLCVTTLA